MTKWGNREIRTEWDLKPRPANGGGVTFVEKRASRTIDQMFARMLATGELQTAQRLKSNDGQSKERAVALMAASKESPLYIKDGEIYNTLTQMKVLEANIKDKTEKKEKDTIINTLASKKAKEMMDKTV